MARFSGKIVLVTGSGEGIGRETALAFAAEGATVIVSDRNSATGQATLADVQRAGSSASRFIAADVSEPAQVDALFDAIGQHYGHLDIAINNAGVEGLVAPIEAQTDANFAHVIDVNVKGTFLCMRAAVRMMKPRGVGVIINFASIAAHVGFAGLSVYAASKHAILGMTKAAALENARDGIRVAAISPGLVDTEMLARFVGHDAANKKAFEDAVPIGRSCTAIEIARGVLFLASEDGALLVGQTLNLDGGWANVKS
jgi:NAD(P)-dependent dehydrogenase (short-subunit alcohol dehydrogenase family)